MTRNNVAPETQMKVLAALDRRQVNGAITAGVEEIGAWVGVGRNTASRALMELADMGALQIIREGTGDGYPTTYQLNLDGDDDDEG